MREKYKNLLMWALYGLLFVLVAAVQTVMLGKAQMGGVKLSLIPVVLACVAMHTGAEGGALYGLVIGAIWCFLGADGGALHILLLTLCGAAVGYACDRLLKRQIVSALLMSFGTLLICQGMLFLFKLYLGTAVPAHGGQMLLQVAVSMLACPFLYLAAWGIRKAGAA